MNYNPWPIGKLPKELQRPEPELIRELGYQWDDARDIVTIFENEVAEFAGSKYAVAVDCCTHAIELSLKYLWKMGEVGQRTDVYLPYHTYVSVFHLLEHMGIYPVLSHEEWTGIYQLCPLRIFDGAVRWKRGMYVGGNALQCLSFQIKKRIPIGRGGMVLTDDKEAADWIRLAAYDGRDLKTPYDSPGHVKFPGYHYYMIPEDAARGLLLMHSIKEEGDSANWTNYPNIKAMLNL